MNEDMHCNSVKSITSFFINFNCDLVIEASQIFYDVVRQSRAVLQDLGFTFELRFETSSILRNDQVIFYAVFRCIRVNLYHFNFEVGLAIQIHCGGQKADKEEESFHIGGSLINIDTVPEQRIT